MPVLLAGVITVHGRAKVLRAASGTGPQIQPGGGPELRGSARSAAGPLRRTIDRVRKPAQRTMSQNDPVDRARGEAFVGRRAELADLASAGAEVAGSGRGQMVVIAGDAGVGKTRLVQEFADTASRDGWTTAIGGCVDVAAGALTYAALIEILRHLDRHLGRDVMAELAGAGIDDLAPLLPGASGGQPGAGGRLLERMLDFLVRLGDVAPAAVVMEDLHWADSSSRDLISFLARNIHAARVLFIVTYRADDLHRRHPLKSLLAEVERSDASWIRLAGLARRDVAELVAKAAGAAAARDLSLLLDRTGGNPFFIEELLAASTPVISLPEGLRELLLARLHDLPDPALAVLRPASVLGQGFTEDLLGAATGLPLPQIEDALRQAVDYNILRAIAGKLRFRHDLLREAIYDDLLPAQRHRLHLAVAAAIEADETIVDPSGARWGVLAFHWKSAGDRMRALGASIQAARWASLVGAPSEAADHLETALMLWEQTAPDGHPDGTDRAALLEQAAEARFSAGQALRARTLAVAAVTELADSPDVERVALAHLQAGVYSRVAGEARASAEAFERAVGLLADRPPSSARAVVMARYAGFLMVGQRVRQGLVAVEAALDLACRTGSRHVEGHALCTKGVLLGESGRLEEGLQLLHDSCEIAREVGQADDLARAFQNLTYVQLFAGLADQALATADAGLQLVRRLGTMLSSGIGITEHQAEAAVRVGRWDDALALLDAFPYDALEGSTLVSFAAPRFDVFLRRGDLDAAARTLALAMERAAAMDDAQFGANTRIRAAQLAVATGHLDDAGAQIAAALAISDRCDDMIYAPKACSVGISAEAARPAPDLTIVETLTTRLSSIEAMARSFGGQLLAEPAAFAAMARAEARELSRGPQPEAWQAAATAWDHCGDVYWAAVCRYQTADALLRAKGDRSVAARITAEALAAARSLDAAPLAADLEVLSRRGRLAAGSIPERPLRQLGVTEREAEVLDLLVEGRTNRQIGDVLFISEKTVSVHVTNLLRKLGAESRTEAAEMRRRLP
jgi:DNA-binding NarL/FixJ family response regulator